MVGYRSVLHILRKLIDNGNVKGEGLIYHFLILKRVFFVFFGGGGVCGEGGQSLSFKV